MLSELFQSPALWFTVPALLGTGIFVIKLSLVLMGFDHHGDGGDAADAAHHHGDAGDGGAFKLISVQAAFGFIMGFGWGGLLGLKSFDWSPAVSVIAGLVGGLLMAFLVSLLLHSVRKLESSGNVSTAKSVGLDGVVYASVPAKGEGRGQVRLVLGSTERIVNATSDGPAIASGARVRVLQAHADESVVVAPV